MGQIVQKGLEMRVFSLAAMALVSVTQMAHAQEHSAESVAAAVLGGFVQQDLQTILAFATESEAESAAEVLADAESAAELAEGLFEDLRGQAAIGWDGMILPARYDDLRAVVPYAIEGEAGPAALGSGVTGRYIVMSLELDGPDDTTWGLSDYIYVTRESYMRMSQTRP